MGKCLPSKLHHIGAEAPESSLLPPENLPEWDLAQDMYAQKAPGTMEPHCSEGQDWGQQEPPGAMRFDKARDSQGPHKTLSSSPPQVAEHRRSLQG